MSLPPASHRCNAPTLQILRAVTTKRKIKITPVRKSVVPFPSVASAPLSRNHCPIVEPILIPIAVPADKRLRQTPRRQVVSMGGLYARMAVILIRLGAVLLPALPVFFQQGYTSMVLSIEQTTPGDKTIEVYP